jgi:hypothetical protein
MMITMMITKINITLTTVTAAVTTVTTEGRQDTDGCSQHCCPTRAIGSETAAPPKEYYLDKVASASKTWKPRPLEMSCHSISFPCTNRPSIPTCKVVWCPIGATTQPSIRADTETIDGDTLEEMQRLEARKCDLQKMKSLRRNHLDSIARRGATKRPNGEIPA